MLIRDILRELDLGSSVAEHDEALEAYFVETAVFRELLAGITNSVAGDKGTGKTALYRILQRRSAAALRDIEVLAALNPVGMPGLQRLTEGDPLTEGQYITIWKAYIDSARSVGVELEDEQSKPEDEAPLTHCCSGAACADPDDSPSAIFLRDRSTI